MGNKMTSVLTFKVLWYQSALKISRYLEFTYRVEDFQIIHGL